MMEKAPSFGRESHQGKKRIDAATILDDVAFTAAEGERDAVDVPSAQR